MKAPFKTTTVYNYQEYFRFNRALMLTPGTMLKFAALEACVVVASVLTKNPFILVFCVLFPLLVLLLQNGQIKRAYKSKKVVQNAEIRFAFYDTYFTQNTASGESRLDYDNLFGLLETRTNMYLMISKQQGYILCKSAFPQGLEEFLRSKIKKCRM